MQLIKDQIFIAYLRAIGVEVIDGVAQNPERVEMIRLTQTSVSDLSGIGQFRNLRELYCSDAPIATLDLSNNTELQELNCFNTQITELDLSANKELRSLNCSRTQIAELDLSANKGLCVLNCFNTQITELDLSANKGLCVLDCFNTQITSLDISACPELRVLHCSNTRIPLWQPCASGIFFAKPEGRTCLLRPDGTVIAGCFCGTLDEFEAAAMGKYGNNTTKNYQPEIERLKQILEQNP